MYEHTFFLIIEFINLRSLMSSKKYWYIIKLKLRNHKDLFMLMKFWGNIHSSMHASFNRNFHYAVESKSLHKLNRAFGLNRKKKNFVWRVKHDVAMDTNYYTEVIHSVDMLRHLVSGKRTLFSHIDIELESNLDQVNLGHRRSIIKTFWLIEQTFLLWGHEEHIFYRKNYVSRWFMNMILYIFF